MFSGFVLQVTALSQAHADAMENQISSELGSYMGIYMLNQNQRTPGDRVVTRKTSSGYHAKIYYWRSYQKRNALEEICQAYEWLLFGRTSYGNTAKEAFQKYPKLQSIELHLFDILFGTKLGDKRGEILPTKKIVEHLKIGVKRSTVLSKDFQETTARSLLEKKQCSEVRKKYFTSYWVNRDYLKSVRS